MITEGMYEIQFPIIIEKNLARHEYDSFARGYHMYMDIWNPLIGMILKCKWEPTNEVDKHAVAIMRSNSLGKESVIGHIPENVSKFSLMFLMTLFTSIEVEVVGKNLNHGGGHGLETPIKYCFYGLEKIVQWLTKKLKTLKEEVKL